MWGNIKRNGIVTHTKTSTGKFASTIPEGTASLVSTRLINMIRWIHGEFMKDALTHPQILQNTNINKREAFITRNTSRVCSYVNHVCSLEHILVRLYNETISKLQVLDRNIIIDTAGLKARKVEVANFFTFRNKVSAHTAYGSPLKEDNSAMEFHSLIALLSSSYDRTEKADSFALGAVSVKLAGQDPSTDLPCLGLKELHPKIMAHIEAWEKMLIDPCILAKKKVPTTIGNTDYRTE